MAVVRDEAIDGTDRHRRRIDHRSRQGDRLRTGLPQIVVPTTYAGSEMTAILGETEGGEKKTLRDPQVLPETVIYDVDLTLDLPPAFRSPRALTRIAHARRGALCAGRRAGAAADGRGRHPRPWRRPLRRGRRAVGHGGAKRRLYGAWLCGTVLGGAEMGLHHKLCHVLGGSFGLPHAETHAVMLPHAAAYNAAAAPEAMARVARALGASEAPAALFDLGRVSAPRRRSRTSGCRPTGSTAPPTSRSPMPTQSAAARPRRDPGAARRRLAGQAAGHMNGALTTPWPACGTGLPRHATRGAGTTASHTLPSLRSPPRLLQRAGTSRPSIAWYERVLGFTVEVRHHIDAVSRRHGDARSGDRCGSSCPMSPTPSRFPTSGGSPNTDHYTHGTKHVGFAVAHIRCAGRGRDGTRRRATTPFSARRRSRSSPSSATIPAISSRFVEQPDLWSADAAGEKTSERP